MNVFRLPKNSTSGLDIEWKRLLSSYESIVRSNAEQKYIDCMYAKLEAFSKTHHGFVLPPKIQYTGGRNEAHNIP